MTTQTITRFDKKQHEQFNAIHWTSQAISKDKYRSNITCLLVEEGAVVATDGHRLHKATLEHGLPPGMYEVAKLTKTIVELVKSDRDVECFPDYTKVLPTSFGETFVLNGDIDGAYAQVARQLQETEALSHAFFVETYLPGTTCKLSTGGAFSPVTFETNDTIAVIMPKRIK